MNGHYRMARGWMGHPMFGREPLCKRAAWVWLIEHAAFRSHTVRLGGKEITLKRGQLISSVRHLATEWGWKPTRVHRFLKKLEGCHAIGTAGATVGATAPRIITIWNYEKYQAALTMSATASETPTVAQPEQERKKEKEGKEYPYGTDGQEPSLGSPTINPTAIIFGQCLMYLTQNGVRDKNARSLLGKWRKDHGVGNVIEIITEASQQAVSEPVAWIEKALRARYGCQEPQEVAPL